MWKTYKELYHRYPKITLEEERKLIAKAQKGSKEKVDELVLRHIGFVIYRIYKKTLPAYCERFGEDMLSEAIFVLQDKVKTYDLKYKDKEGQAKPVRFASYIWKRIDGFIVDYLNQENQRNDGLQ